MKESIIERTMKPLPVPFEEFEEFSTPMQEFFDLIARRPFELLGATPRFFARELESFFKTEPEVFRPVNLKLFETEEALIVRAEVPGFTEKELDINAEPWRLVITANYDAGRTGLVYRTALRALPARLQMRDRLTSRLRAGAHQHHHPLGLGVPGVLHQSVAAAGALP